MFKLTLFALLLIATSEANPQRTVKYFGNALNILFSQRFRYIGSEHVLQQANPLKANKVIVTFPKVKQ